MKKKSETLKTIEDVEIEREKIFIITKQKKLNLWTEEEDETLLRLIDLKNKNLWVDVSKYFKDKNSAQCRARYKRIRPGIIKGSWSEMEDKKIIELIDKFGKDWAKIAKYTDSRNGKQIRDRYINYLDPHLNKSLFTDDDDRLIIKSYKILGPKWSIISKKFIGRTSDMIKNRFHSHLRKKIHFLAARKRKKISLKIFPKNTLIQNEFDCKNQNLEKKSSINRIKIKFNYKKNKKTNKKIKKLHEFNNFQNNFRNDKTMNSEQLLSFNTQGSNLKNIKYSNNNNNNYYKIAYQTEKQIETKYTNDKFTNNYFSEDISIKNNLKSNLNSFGNSFSSKESDLNRRSTCLEVEKKLRIFPIYFNDLDMKIKINEYNMNLFNIFEFKEKFKLLFLKIAHITRDVEIVKYFTNFLENYSVFLTNDEFISIYTRLSLFVDSLELNHIQNKRITEFVDVLLLKTLKNSMNKA